MKNGIVNILVSLITFLVLIVIVECFFRLAEGLSWSKLSVSPKSMPAKDLEGKARKMASQINSGYLTAELYDINPLKKEKLPVSEAVKKISLEISDVTENKDLRVFNINYLNKVYCTGEKNYAQSHFKEYNEWVYTYGSYDTKAHPVYTFLLNTSGIHDYNKTQFYDFGWGGDKVNLAKPDNVIRIAFIGGSTSQHMGGCDWAYPDYIGAWLNQWASGQAYDIKFEIINTGRVAQTSPDFLAITKFELLPANPDFVIYYEGRNQFHINELIYGYQNPDSQKGYKIPQVRSVFFQKIKYVLNSIKKEKQNFSHNYLKPILPLDINENHPNPYNPSLPISLPQIVKDLDSIRYYLKSIDSELILTSFGMMVDEGIEYDPMVNQSIIDYWNHDYPAVSWKGIKRLNQLHNRVFEEYAKINEVDFIGVDKLLTLEPDLFLDGIHLHCKGMKYKSWIILRDLLPIIKKEIDDKKLPRIRKKLMSKHPYITGALDRVNLDCKSISSYIASKKNQR